MPLGPTARRHGQRADTPARPPFVDPPGYALGTTLKTGAPDRYRTVGALRRAADACRSFDADLRRRYAWRGLVACGSVKLGDTVLVLGTSAVSLFALQFAKAAGAQVIATSSSEEKLKKLEDLGADAVINYKETADWGRRAKELTDGRGVDHVIEVGGPQTLAQSIAACRTGGHIALIGVLTGLSGALSVPDVFSNQIRISGISIGSRADQENMIRAFNANRLKPIVDRCFSLQDIAAAFEHYESQTHFGKLCLEF